MSLERTVQRTSKFLLLEFSDLDELLKDVQKQELLLQQVQDKKNIQALTKYYTKRIEKEERYAERIERRLNRWIKRLDKLLLVVELNIANDIKEQLETIRAHIDICNNTIITILAKGGELHKLIKQEQVSWKEVEAKIKEALGDNNHPGVRSLIIIIEELQQLETKQEDAVRQSKDIAKSKLAKIMDNFDNYGIRFMNLMEYQQIVEQRKLENGEIFVPKMDSIKRRGRWKMAGDPRVCFEDYIHLSVKRGWINVVIDQADVEYSTHNQEVIQKLKEIIEYQRTILIRSGKYNKQELLRAIRNELLRIKNINRRGYNYLWTLLGDVEGLLKHEVPFGSIFFENKQQGKKRAQIVEEFLTDEDWLTKDKHNLSLLIDSLKFANYNHKQYHLAFILDTTGITKSGYHAPRTEWNIIDKDIPNPESKVLAVIVVISNKKLLSTVIAESSHAQEWAHPVFDWKGKVRWP